MTLKRDRLQQYIQDTDAEKEYPDEIEYWRTSTKVNRHQLEATELAEAVAILVEKLLKAVEEVNWNRNMENLIVNEIIRKSADRATVINMARE